jgi:DNA-binding response OmpR family regulator
MSRILIIEDEPALLRALTDNFRFEAHEVLTAADGQTGYAIAVQQMPDIIILDLMLPQMSGYEVCRKLRAEQIETPILMLTARGDESDRVRGLDLGADDYVTKPFSLAELSARVRALLRRGTKAATNALHELRFGEVRIDFRSYQAWRGERRLEMTRKEFAVLRLLASRAGEAITRDELIQQIWGEDTHVTNRTVDTHIANLRVKLERDPRHPDRLITVHGVGYRWQPELHNHITNAETLDDNSKSSLPYHRQSDPT